MSTTFEPLRWVINSPLMFLGALAVLIGLIGFFRGLCVIWPELPWVNRAGGLVAVFWLAAVTNKFLSVGISSGMGGTTADGYSANGKYYLGSNRRYREVPESVYVTLGRYERLTGAALGATSAALALAVAAAHLTSRKGVPSEQTSALTMRVGDASHSRRRIRATEDGAVDDS